MAGPVTDHLSWHWLFWVPLLLAVPAFVGIVFGVRESPVRNPGRIDVLGAVLLSAGLVCLLLALSKGGGWGWGNGATLGLFAGAVLALVAWVGVERRVREPLVDLRMMARRGVWTANLTGLAFGFAMFGSFLLIPQLLQLPAATGYGFGLSVSEAGLYLVPSAVGMLVFGPVSGALGRRFGAKVPLALGTVVAAASFVVPAIAHDREWQLLISSALMGIGTGLAFAAMANAIVAAVPPAQTGVATGVNTISRSIGGSIGTAVLAAILAANAGTDDGFTTTFWVGAGMLGLAFLAALLLPSGGRDRDDATAYVETPSTPRR